MFKKTITCLFLLFIMQLPLHSHAADMSPEAQQWANYKITSQPPSTVTASAINELLKQKGKSDKAKNGDIGTVIMDVGTKNGINPAIIFSMFVIETGWGENSKFTEWNNPGGITCKTGFPCKPDKSGRMWTYFESVDQGFQVKAELLKNNYVGEGKDTIRTMLEKYAPSSENNLYESGGYIANIGAILKTNFNISPDGATGTMSATGGNYSDGTESGSWKKYNFFMESDAVQFKTGIDGGNKAIPTEISYAFDTFSIGTSSKLTFLGTALSLLLLLYISITIFAYVLLVKGKTTSTSLLFKLIRIEGDLYSNQIIGQILMRTVIAVGILCLYLTGLYIKLMSLIYTGINNIFYYIFD